MSELLSWVKSHKTVGYFKNNIQQNRQKLTDFF